MRVYENINVTLTGTFEITAKENVTRFVLTYKEKKENSFISNCTGSLIESFTEDNNPKPIVFTKKETIPSRNFCC